MCYIHLLLTALTWFCIPYALCLCLSKKYKCKVKSKKSAEYPPLRPVLDRWQQVGDSCAVSRRAILIRWETESCRGHRRIVRVNILPRPPELWLETTDNVATMVQQSPELLTHSGHWWKLNCSNFYSGEHKYWHTLPTCSINNKQ